MLSFCRYVDCPLTRIYQTYTLQVFSQPFLAKIICEIESHMDDVGLSRSRVSTNQWTSTVRQQILELEGPTYQYVLMFSMATISQVRKT